MKNERCDVIKTALLGGVSLVVANNSETGSVRQQIAASIASFCLLTTIMEVLNGKEEN